MRVDAHTHLEPKPERLKHLLSTMAAIGMDRAVVVGGGLRPASALAPRQGDPSPDSAEMRALRFDHERFLALCAEAGGRLIPFYFANPHQGPAEYRAIGSRFQGLKLGPIIHGVPLASVQTKALVEVARTFQHPVYLHCLDRDGFRVADLVVLAAQFPSVTFILGHGGIGQLDFACVEEIVAQPNILYETSGSFLAPVRYAVQRLGAGRVLFGSEHPLQSARAELAKIEDLGLTPAELRAVLGENVAALFARAEAGCA